MTAIITRNLSCNFNGVIAVDNLNLNVEEGSIFGLIGPNGAGKTTTLRMLSGLQEPSSGEIRINQLNIDKYRQEIQWQVGYMPDFFGVYEDLLVWEYLDFFARCYKLSSMHRKRVVEELLELVDLSKKHDEYIHNLSRGMLQRLCLAHSLIHNPQILLLDEPASGLDPRARIEMRELILELRAMGKTILLSSHILRELSELCDTIGILEKGRLLSSGTLDQVRSRVNQSRKMKLKIHSPFENTSIILSDNPMVGNLPTVEESSLDWEFSFSGDEGQAAELLHSLVSQGVPVVYFGESTSNIEDIYMKLTNTEDR